MDIIKFFKHDIWQITEQELTKTKRLVYRIVRVVALSLRAVLKERLILNASALTFSILFAIVPILAIIVAVSRGFGVEKLIEQSLEQSFMAQSELIPTFMLYVNNYIETTQGGIFIGVGLVVLLVSIMNFFIQVELAFNGIWQVKKSRSVLRQFNLYISALLIIPIFIVLSSGLSIYINGIIESTAFYNFLSPFLVFVLKISPFVVNWIIFTLMYLIIPNTKVKFNNALIAGIIAGTSFQLFQYLYIDGQVYLSRYNIVYGSFAAIPLLLLWLQVSCLIVLIGAEISYASQNYQYYEYENDSENISIRYRNFLTLFIVWFIVKNFIRQNNPYTSEKIAFENKIPIRIANQILENLVEAKILIEVFNESDQSKAYQPAMDIHQLSVNLLFEKIETAGSEHFLENKNPILDEFWHKTHSKSDILQAFNSSVLIKDI